MSQTWSRTTIDGEELLPLVATTIPDAWFKAIDALFKVGRLWRIDKGSYEKQWRLEFDRFDARILYPGARPLVPVVADHLPPPVSADYVENDYLSYLMTDTPPKAGEDYTYGERIAPQIEKIITRYKDNGVGSNQECISISRPEDIDLEDPPCLRSIDCRIYPPGSLRVGEELALHFHVYFRSWALYGGFPGNLAAIRLMQEYMAHSLDVAAGDIYASSKGLHLYDHEWEVAAEVAKVELPEELKKILRERDEAFEDAT